MNASRLRHGRRWLLGLLIAASLPVAHAQDDAEHSALEPVTQSPEASQPGVSAQESRQAAPVAAESLETIAVPAIRAERASGAEPSAEDGDLQQLDDIVVTATKREKSAREIPVSITALRGEELEKAGARDIKDYLMQVPGITLVDSEYGEARGRNLTVRGVGPGSYTGLGNQTMGQFIGDVPMNDPFGNFGAPDLDPFDLETVEILRGPQGTTFGASALNGAIRYAPNKPELGRWLARGFVDRVSVKDGGADQTYALAANAPVGDYAALRVSGVLQNAPGLYDNLQRGIEDADSRRKWTGRAAFRWEPTDRLSVNLMGLKQQSHSDDVLLADNPDGRFENDYKVGPSYIDFGFSLASLDLRYELDSIGTLVLQSNWQKKRSWGDVDTNLSLPAELGVATIHAPFDYDTHGNSQELRLVSQEGGRWDWIVGAFRRDYQASVHAGVLVGPLTVLESDIDPLDAEETAFYGELTRRFGDHWEVTAGARRYTTSLQGVQFTSALGTVPSNSNPVGQEEDGVSPKFSLTYKASPNLMAYATIARGFQFGGVNTTVAPLSFENPATGVPIPTSYDSSVLWSREIGLRTDWLDRTLRLDLALFDIRWSEAQLQQYTGGQVSNDPYVDNVGEVHIRGAEGSFSWLTPLPGLAVYFNASYTDARTREEYEQGGVVIPSGSELPAVPRVQTSTTLAYNTFVGRWVGGASLSYAQWSEAFGNLEHSYSIFDFGTLGLNLNIARPDVSLTPSVTLGISNLTDERGVVGRLVPMGSLPVGPAATWNYIRPRTINLRLTFEFQ
jgi:iron complex outermembrane receptor protein